MKRLQKATALSIFLAAWLPGYGSTDETAAGQPSLQTTMAKETTLDRSFSIASEDKFVTATVSGSAKPSISVDEGLYYITVPINTQIAAECLLYEDSMDSAATLQAVTKEMLSDFDETRIVKIDAGTFEHLPYLYQEQLYMVNEGAAGILKGIVVPIADSTLVCIHDEPGYSETFKQMVGGLADSMRFSGFNQTDWKYQEILIWDMQNLNVGYTAYNVSKPNEGEIMSITETALLIPRNPKETASHDGYDVTLETESGVLVNGRYAEAENGNLTLLIDLGKSSQNSYRVSGQFQGKEIDSKLNSKVDLSGPFNQYAELIKAAYPKDGKSRTLNVDVYVPSVNPLDTVSIEAKPTGQRVDGMPEYTLLFGGMKATSIIDKTGQQSMTVLMGQLKMKLNRVYMNGHI